MDLNTFLFGLVGENIYFLPSIIPPSIINHYLYHIYSVGTYKTEHFRWKEDLLERCLYFQENLLITQSQLVGFMSYLTSTFCGLNFIEQLPNALHRLMEVNLSPEYWLIFFYTAIR